MPTVSLLSILEDIPVKSSMHFGIVQSELYEFRHKYVFMCASFSTRWILESLPSILHFHKIKLNLICVCTAAPCLEYGVKFETHIVEKFGVSFGREGETLSFGCSVIIYPSLQRFQPEIEWYRDGKTVISDSVSRKIDVIRGQIY